ncbi:recombinase family protein [Streptomyces sp. SP2-10]|uniref:recombinase family protein n=1 Tax=Streptomyces sp. SP2-10 TaxID=2873385 RepID=UPI00223B1EA5|nr:recombinase family protein [Streptomyces sp. SP2-10]
MAGCVGCSSGPGEDQHPGPRTAQVRGSAADGAGGQGPRPALPGHLHRVPGRDAAELTALADHLTAHGLVLEMLAGPLPHIYDPTGPGKLLFAFFSAMAETERENNRESTLEGLDTAAHKGKHDGRPPVITDDMLHTVLRRRALGESVEQIQPDLFLPTGKRKGQNPSVASIYQALAEHAKREAYPEAVGQAHADFAALTANAPSGRQASRDQDFHSRT